MAKTETAPTLEDFHTLHRGGSGRVLLAVGYLDGEQEHQGIFGSIETAEEYMGSLPDEIAWIIIPYVVDDPEWGDRRSN